MPQLIELMTKIAAQVERRWTTICLLVALVLCAIWIRSITDSPIRHDAIETTLMAVNLVHNGVIAGEQDDIESLSHIRSSVRSDSNATAAQPQRDAPSRPLPTMYREPFPALSAAAGVVIADAFFGAAEPDDYLTGVRARFLKYQNVVWKAITVLAAYLFLFNITTSRPMALLGAILIGTSQPDLDTLYSEPVAAALLISGAALLAVGFSRRALSAIALAGLCFGFLALTKAAFLYVFIGLIVAVPIIEIGLARGEARRKLVSGIIVLAVTFGAVTFPWMYRNYVRFDRFQIAERAGTVLYLRALYDQMTWQEYGGSFYVWSPSPVKALVGAVTGFHEGDLERDGRLRRFNYARNSSFAASDLAAEQAGRPDAAISLYRQERAERVRLRMQYHAAGHPRSMVAADDELKRRSILLLREHPLRHLAWVIPYIWWSAALMFPLLLVALTYSIRSSRRSVLLFIVPGLGLLAFYALFTVFEPRYGIPVRPLAIVAGIVLLASAWDRIRATFLGPQPTAARGEQ